MNVNSIERVLWDLCSIREKAIEFSDSPASVLSEYELDSESNAAIESKNVLALARAGVSQMLLMLFWSAVSGGLATLPEYLGRMNAK